MVRPWSRGASTAGIVVAAGLFLEPRYLLVVYMGLILAMAILGAYLGPIKSTTTGAQIVTLASVAGRAKGW